MNKTTPYEDLIAAKLDQIAVPDMSDSIWANIEMQLNELPDAPGQKSSGVKTGSAWYGIITLSVVVTLCWWFYNNKKPLPQKEVIPPAQIITPPVAKDSPVIIEKIVIPKLLPVIIKKDTVASIAPIPEGKEEEKAIPIVVDSPAVIKHQVFDTIAVRPPGKKPKGVKGITGDDYRLSVEKDSIHP